MPENLQQFMNDYDRQRAAEEASVGRIGKFLGKYSSLVGLTLAGTIMYLMYSLDDVSSEIQVVFGNILHLCGPRTARKILVGGARWGLLPSDYDKDDPYLIIEPWEGFNIMNPVGLASGLDRKAVGVNAFLNMGFGFVEVGPAVTAEDVQQVVSQLASRDKTRQVCHFGLIGCAVGGQSRLELVQHMHALGRYVDYVAVNLSKIPQALRSETELKALVADLRGAASTLPNGGPAVFLRVPADYPSATASAQEQREAAVAAAQATLAGGGAGLVLCHGDSEDAEPGLAKDVIADVYRSVEGRLMLIACGGINIGEDALALIEAGATVVQISSLLLDEGPPACRRLKNEMSHVIVMGAYTLLQDAVGAAHRKKKAKVRNPWKNKGVAAA